MTTLVNANGAAPAQDDADTTLAVSIVGEINRTDPRGGLSTEFDEVAYRQRCAKAKDKAVDEARQAVIETEDWAAFQRTLAAMERDDSDVPYSERGRHVDTCREPWLLYDLKPKRGWLSPAEADIYEHRLETSDALYEAGHPGAHGRLFLPGFGWNARAEATSWRPWNVKLLDSPVSPESPLYNQRLTAMQKKARFDAILNQIEGEHLERHWFYAHPYCAACFPADHLTVGHYLAGWVLRNGENRFPSYEWDGQVPPMPVVDELVDFMADDDLDDLPEPSWLIDGILPDHGTGVLRARDQSFKSFMALAMALQVVTDGGKALYCVGEGVNQFKHRRDAWLEHNGFDQDDLEGNLVYLPAVPNLFTGGDLYDKVLAKARREKFDLIVIDTYARATSGSDLNSQGDQSVVTARVDEIKRATDGTVLLVAHSQKADQDSSGSIEIEDARDFVFSMKRNGSEVTFEVTKQKDGVESLKPLRYVTKQVSQSIVLVEAGQGGEEPLMTTKDWIVAALDNTTGLGPQSESDIRGWINTHPDHRRLGNKELTKSTSSSTLSRLVQDGRVLKHGARYSLSPAQGQS
jgi:hypothetical protein